MRQIVITTIALMVCLVTLSGCKSKQAIATDHTTSMPAWLQEKTAALAERHCEITLFDVNGENYYSVFVKGPDRSYDMNRTTIYDADGNVYLSLGGPRRRTQKEIDFFSRATNKGIIWQSKIAQEKEKSIVETELEPKSE